MTNGGIQQLFLTGSAICAALYSICMVGALVNESEKSERSAFMNLIACALFGIAAGVWK